MFVLIGIVFGLYCVVSIWIHSGHINRLGVETNKLKAIIKELLDILKKEGIAIPEGFKSKELRDSSEIQADAIASTEPQEAFLKEEITEPSMENRAEITENAAEITENAAESVVHPVLEEVKISPETDSSFIFEESKTVLSKKVLSKIPVAAMEEKPIDLVTEYVQEEVDAIPKSDTQINFEQKFGAHLLVWLGGIALALAGFFLVKYSVENNFFTPIMRVISGGLLGIILLCVGDWIRRKPDFANGVRIAQSLSGAGIAVLYGSIFASISLYQLIPHSLGFVGMAAITALAVLLSLKHGQAIALLGLVGGFLTPFLVGSNDPSAPILFIYLYVVFSGLMILIKQKNWWTLSIPALCGSFLWVGAWITNNFTDGDSIWLALFLMGVCINIVISSKHAYEEEHDSIAKDKLRLISIFNYIGLGGAVVLMAIIADKADFGFLEWALFGLLTIGSIGLAYFNDKLYGFVPLVSMAANIIMLSIWDTPELYIFTITLCVFAFLYIGSGYVFMWRSGQPLMWVGSVAVGSILFYLLAYSKYYPAGLVDLIPLLWGAIAFALAGIAIYALQKVRGHFHFHDNPHKEYLLTIFASTATLLIAIGLSVELDLRFWSVAFAVEMLIISWINSRIPIKALRPICMVLASIIGALLIMHLFAIMQSLGGSPYLLWTLFGNANNLPWPIFQFGLSSLMFSGTAYFLRRRLYGDGYTDGARDADRHEDGQADGHENADRHEKQVRALELAGLGFGGIMLLMGIFADKASFGFLEWSLFGMRAIGGICQAYSNSKRYGFVPLLSMAGNILMLSVWETSNVLLFTLILFMLASIYIGAGYLLIWRAKQSLLWAGLAGAGSIGFYLLAYFKLDSTGLVYLFPSFWVLVAFALAGIAIFALKKARGHFQFHDNPHKEYLLAIFASTATLLISIGLTIELEQKLLPVAFALEMLIISWINSRVSIKALPYICMALASCFGILFIPQIELLFLVHTPEVILEWNRLMLLKSLPIVQYPIFYLGLPALMFFGTSYFLRLDKDGKLVRALEIAGVALATAMAYFLTRHTFHEWYDILFVKAGFFERGVTTNIIFIFGLLCFIIGRRFDRIAFSWSGIGLCAIASLRIICFDLFIHNPLWDHQAISSWFILNSLLLPYGLPILWGWFASKQLCHMNRDKWAKYTRGFIFLLLFIFISLNVRFLFHGEYLDSKILTNAEVYSYSVAWLLLGVGLLIAGIVKHDRALRYASLGVMLLTTAKVFLYDAAELEGLYRIFSFFGLGLSLLGLSWFYTRFVFGNSAVSGNQAERSKDD